MRLDGVNGTHECVQREAGKVGFEGYMGRWIDASDMHVDAYAVRIWGKPMLLVSLTLAKN
jgi:hypothetical protein